MLRIFARLPGNLKTPENLISLLEIMRTDDDDMPDIILTMFLGLREDQQNQLTLTLMINYHQYIPDVIRLTAEDRVRLDDKEQIYYYLKKAIESGLKVIKH